MRVHFDGFHRNEIPLYARNGIELRPRLTAGIYRTVYNAVRRALRHGERPSSEQIDALAQLGTGEFVDQNGNLCPVPERVRLKALQLSARLVTHV